jgi:hypothetical protein
MILSSRRVALASAAFPILVHDDGSRDLKATARNASSFDRRSFRVSGSLFPSRALPHDAGISLQRNQRFASIGPLRRIADGNMIPRLPAGPAFEQRPGYVHHLRRVSALIKDGRTASSAKTSRRARGLVFETGDDRGSLRKAEPTPPTADICRVGGALRMPSFSRMVMPSAARRNVDFEADFPAQTLSRCDRGGFFSNAVGRRPLHIRPCSLCCREQYLSSAVRYQVAVSAPTINAFAEPSSSAVRRAKGTVRELAKCWSCCSR